MLRPRIIPCLLVQNKGLVKTVQFNNPKYVGDPINAVKIFNEKQADELILLDIDRSTKNSEPDYLMIENIATECRMPLCYGGGIKNVAQALKIFKLGVEKISLSSIVIENPKIITEIANKVGNQSLVVTLDIKKNKFNKYEIFIENGKVNTKLDLIDFIKNIQEMGVGEIVINSIDNDGMMKGYDFHMISQVKEISNVPTTYLGGAGSLDDLKKIIKACGIIGVSAGSLFVFKGKFKAVLINYPNPLEKEKLINESFYPNL